MVNAEWKFPAPSSVPDPDDLSAARQKNIEMWEPCDIRGVAMEDSVASNKSHCRKRL
jgi:hypothetical protein